MNPRRPERPCFLHIGTHKTGTTSIQCFLTGNRERFAAHGLYFPHAGRDEDKTIAHHALANDLLGDPGASDVVLDQLAGELRGTDAGAACLTSENLSFLFDRPNTLRTLRDAIRDAGFTPRILVYLRAQTSYCAALFAENVRQGYRTSFRRYLRDILEHGTYRWNGNPGQPFDYRRLLDGFAAVFGREAVIARPYRSEAPPGKLLLSFARHILPRGAPLNRFDIPRLRHNESLRFAGVLKQLDIANAIDPAVRFAPLDFTMTAQLMARFMRSNVGLARRYRVIVPAAEPADVARALLLGIDRPQSISLKSARRALAAAADDGAPDVAQPVNG